MLKTVDEWFKTLNELCQGTEYEPMINGGSTDSTRGIAIVPKGKASPQRICIYPKETVGAGFVIEMDIYKLLSSKGILVNYARIKGNRPHYNRLSDDEIITACKLFLKK